MKVLNHLVRAPVTPGVTRPHQEDGMGAQDGVEIDSETIAGRTGLIHDRRYSR